MIIMIIFFFFGLVKLRPTELGKYAQVKKVKESTQHCIFEES